MIITSEKTGKQYKTVEECMEAERIYEEELANKKALEQKRQSERKARAKKVEEKYLAVVEAKQAYAKELSDFCKDYGSYHATLSGDNPLITDIWDVLASFRR